MFVGDKYIENAIVFFPIGYTIGIDIKMQNDQVRGVICFSKYTVNNATVLHNINNTNLKDFLQAVGRARKIQYGLTIIFGTLHPQIKAKDLELYYLREKNAPGNFID